MELLEITNVSERCAHPQLWVGVFKEGFNNERKHQMEKKTIPKSLFVNDEIEEKKVLSTSLAATNDAWAKVEAFRILKKYNKKQRGQALSELLDVAIESMSESDREQFNEVYEKTIRRKVESLDKTQG